MDYDFRTIKCIERNINGFDCAKIIQVYTK